MSDKTNYLGTNIKKLRESYGETQMDLALSLDYAPNTISMYEKGHREPDLCTLQKIAHHYCIPLDRLLKDDFSKTDFQNINFNWKNIISMLESMFSILCSEVSLKNTSFYMGYTINNKIMNKIKKGNNIPQSEFINALDYYIKAYDDEEIYEDVANIMWLIFILYSLITDTQDIEIGNSLLYRKISNKDFLKNYILNNDNTNVHARKEKKAYAHDLNLETLSLIQTLKSSTANAELGDYYLALKYIIGFIDNDNDESLNKTIGIEMMLIFLNLENPYAFNFINKSLSM